MIDSRAGLPQYLAGDGLGLPCARLRPIKKKSNGLPTVELKAVKEEGFHLPGGNADTDLTLIAFAGTKPLDLKSARARSQGCLRTGGPLDRVLKLRKENDLERLVDVLVRAAPDQRHDALRYFKQPYNAHRAKMAPRYIDEENRRRLVLQILKKYALCDIYDLIRVDEKQWASISRELGGLSYGVAMRSAMEAVAESMTPLERATCWAAVGTRQRAADHGRSVVFAAQDSPNVLH
ncbi:unnamed protein product [Durusdinium trenchii]|uniref:Uncharacterized protein n=1 Tax=Durusdinium trenchii TaxID=1381693 RepID=A0ABP0HXK6_9DINO